jgi:hypothetical protein
LNERDRANTYKDPENLQHFLNFSSLFSPYISNMKSIVAAIAALAIAAVSAQTTPPVSITSPLTGTVYTAGGQALITWINPTAATLAQIQLAKGPSNALQPVGVVATNVATAGGQYSWTIPADTPAGTDCK